MNQSRHFIAIFVVFGLATAGCSESTSAPGTDGGNNTPPDASAGDAGTHASDFGSALPDAATSSSTTWWTGAHTTEGNIAEDDAYVYFGQGVSGNALHRIKKDGTGLTSISNDAADLVAVTSSSLFYSILSSKTLRRANLDGTGGVDIATSNGFFGVYDLHAEGQTAYFSDESGIHVAHADASAASLLTGGMPYFFALGQGSIFWSGITSLNAVSTDGSNARISWPYSTKYPAAGSQYIYSASGSSTQSTDGLYRFNLDGTSPTLLSFGSGRCRAGATGGVYFLGPGGIWFIKDDGSSLHFIGTIDFNGGIVDFVVDANGIYWLATDGGGNGAVGRMNP